MQTLAALKAITMKERSSPTSDGARNAHHEIALVAHTKEPEQEGSVDATAGPHGREEAPERAPSEPNCRGAWHPRSSVVLLFAYPVQQRVPVRLLLSGEQGVVPWL